MLLLLTLCSSIIIKCRRHLFRFQWILFTVAFEIIILRNHDSKQGSRRVLVRSHLSWCCSTNKEATERTKKLTTGSSFIVTCGFSFARKTDGNNLEIYLAPWGQRGVKNFVIVFALVFALAFEHENANSNVLLALNINDEAHTRGEHSFLFALNSQVGSDWSHWESHLRVTHPTTLEMLPGQASAFLSAHYYCNHTQTHSAVAISVASVIAMVMIFGSRFNCLNKDHLRSQLARSLGGNENHWIKQAAFAMQFCPCRWLWCSDVAIIRKHPNGPLCK